MHFFSKIGSKFAFCSKIGSKFIVTFCSKKGPKISNTLSMADEVTIRLVLNNLTVAQFPPIRDPNLIVTLWELHKNNAKRFANHTAVLC